MTVDLSLGSEGIIGWDAPDKNLVRDRYWCPIIRSLPDGNFRVRIESGWYEEYRRDGTPVDPGSNPQTIVEFVPCNGRDHRARGLRTETCP